MFNMTLFGKSGTAGFASPVIVLGIFLMATGATGCGRKNDKASQTKSESTIQAPAAPPSNHKTAATKPSAPPSQVVNEPGSVTLDTPPPVYDLKMDQKELMEMEATAYSKETHSATFIAKGQVYNGVKVRYRGAWARSWPKKPLKIFFAEKQLFEGQRCINLNSAWRDPAFVRELLSYRIYTACGVPASRARMVRINLNGAFLGLYVEVEQVDKTFLKRSNLKGTTLFKGIARSNRADERDLGSDAAYFGEYERETDKTEGLHDLQVFCQGLAQAPNNREFFEQHVDLERYINYLVASTLVQHWDSYNKNHYLAFDEKGSLKWYVIPWDLDRTLGDFWDWSFAKTDLPILLGTRGMPGITGWNRLEDHFFNDPDLKERFQQRLRVLLETEFTAEKLFPILDRLEAAISSEAASDRRRWPGDAGDLHSGISQLKRYIKERRAFLLSELAKPRSR